MFYGFTHNKIKNSYQFLFWWFNDIMAIQHDGWPWTTQSRAKEMRMIINDYRRLFYKFPNSKNVYSDVHIWKTIIRKYHKNWDTLHWHSLEYDKQRFKPKQ